MNEKLKDRLSLILFSILCAGGAWLFWYLLGDVGFYVIGGIVLVSYGVRISTKIKNK